MNELCMYCTNLDSNKNGLFCLCGQPVTEMGDDCSYYEPDETEMENY